MSWQKIDALQEYPYPSPEPTPDLASACRDEDPLVRAAACMAFGRLAKPEQLPLLTPLLDDKSDLVRRMALAALLRIESPQIKEPLLNVIGTWAELRPPPFYQQQVTWSLQRHGLPAWLTDSNTSLAARQQWLAEFDSAAWKLTFQNDDHNFTWNDGPTRVWIAMPDAEIDADEPIRLRVRIQRRGGRQARKAYLHRETGQLLEVDRAGEFLRREGGQAQLSFVPAANPDATDFVVDLPPNQTIEVEAVARMHRESLLPGLYHLYAFHAEWPLFVRIRRSRDMEAAIPDLLKKLPDQRAVQTLGQQRVKLAVPQLLESFVANAGKNNFAAAKALGRIGDLAAIPVLLKHPTMFDIDVQGSTENQLASFGAAADPLYEESILNWQSALSGKDAGRLALCFRLLGPRGSADVDRARMDLVRHLSQSLRLDREYRNYAELSLLDVAIRGAIPAHPHEVTDAIWVTRDRPEVFDALLNHVRSAEDLRTWKPTIVELARRARQPGEGGVSRERLASLAMTVAPELVLAERSAIESEAEARRVLYFGRHHEPTVANSIARIRDYLERHPVPEVQIGLGALLLRREDHGECEKLFRAALASDRVTEGDVVAAHYYLGMSLLARGESMAGRGELEAALALTKPSRSYGWDSISAERISRELKRAATLPDIAPTIRSQFHMGVRLELNGYVEIADGRAFVIDDSRRLHRWDARTRTKATFGVLPNPVRQFIPAGRERVFVLFQDGTSQLYQEGQRGAAWNGPANIAHFSYLTASATLITVADVEGTLRGIDPATGRTMWKRKVVLRPEPPPAAAQPAPAANQTPASAEVEPFDPAIVFAEPIRMDDFELRTWSGLARQTGPLVLIPEQPLEPRRFDVARPHDGVTQCQVECGFIITALATAGDLAVAVGPQAEVAAASLRDGKILWRTRIAAAGEFTDFEAVAALHGDAKAAYVAVKDRVWALDRDTGRILWTWRWTPASKEQRDTSPYGPYSQLRALPDGVAWIVDWTANPRSSRRDVVNLSATGDVLLHHTSPLQETASARNAFIERRTLHVPYGHEWETWQLRLLQK